MDGKDRLIYGEKPWEYGDPTRGLYYEPTTMLIAGTVVSAVAAVGSGFMSYMQSQSQAAASRQSAAYARMMGERNRQLALYSAQAAREQGQYEATLLRERAQKLLGKQLALYGKAGVDLSGSPLEFMSQSAAEYERDALNAIYGGEFKAWQAESGGETSMLESQGAAGRYESEAAAYESRGTSSLLMAPLAAGSTLLTGYGRYQTAKKYPWTQSLYPGGY